MKTNSNVLFQRALNEVDIIENEFQKLSVKGRCEALIFISIFIYTEASNNEKFKNGQLIEEFLDNIAISVKKSMFFKSNEYVKDFVNDRFKFYNSEYIKNCDQNMYTPMYIYNAFYLKPFANDPTNIRSFNLNPMVLLEFKSFLVRQVRNIESKVL